MLLTTARTHRARNETAEAVRVLHEAKSVLEPMCHVLNLHLHLVNSAISEVRAGTGVVVSPTHLPAEQPMTVSASYHSWHWQLETRPRRLSTATRPVRCTPLCTLRCTQRAECSASLWYSARARIAVLGVTKRMTFSRHYIVTYLQGRAALKQRDYETGLRHMTRARALLSLM